MKSENKFSDMVLYLFTPLNKLSGKAVVKVLQIINQIKIYNYGLVIQILFG